MQMFYGLALYMPNGREAACPSGKHDYKDVIWLAMGGNDALSGGSDGSWLSIGAIVGIAIGGAIGVVLLCGAAFCMLREKAPADGGLSTQVLSRV